MYKYNLLVGERDAYGADIVSLIDGHLELEIEYLTYSDKSIDVFNVQL